MWLSLYIYLFRKAYRLINSWAWRGKVEPEEAKQRTDEPLGLAEWEVEIEPQRESRLDGQVRVTAPAASPADRRRSPGPDSFL